MEGIPDYSTTEIVVAIGGSVGAGAIIMMLLQAIKDFFPNLSGRSAMGAVYLVSFITAILLIVTSNPNYADPLTYISLVIVAGGLAANARGVYHMLFREKKG